VDRRQFLALPLSAAAQTATPPNVVIQDDPEEKRNVLKDQLKIAQELTQALAKHIQRAGRVPWQDG
jgi:hypothetical protein